MVSALDITCFTNIRYVISHRGSEFSSCGKESVSVWIVCKEEVTGLSVAIYDEEFSVPRSGVKVQLTGQRMRWNDGKTYVWLGGKVTAGRGEGSSGLRFDL